MRDYARLQTATLLRRMAFQLNRAERHTDPDSVHNLRVSIRRLSRCLRTFAPLYPDRYWKKIRRPAEPTDSPSSTVPVFRSMSSSIRSYIGVLVATLMHGVGFSP